MGKLRHQHQLIGIGKTFAIDELFTTMGNRKIALWLFMNISSFCVAQDKHDSLSPTNTDSVVTYASGQYQPNSFIRRILMGNNYRNVWRQEVTVPVFHFSQSGLTITELGGGMQTKSLHVLDKIGKEWSLRTVDKDVSNAVIPIESGLMRKASQDLISASFPYGAPIVGELAYAAGITAARPKIFYVADDPALGEFRSVFANTLCMLEERDPGFDSSQNSSTVLANITKDNRYKIQQEVLLKARLFDIIIADWDRHADNWRWGMKDSAGFIFYYAIPRDRDWAFYQSGGWVPNLVQKTGGMPCFVNFTEKVKNVKKLMWKAWAMDKAFLNELTADDWESAVKELQQSLTDAAIEKAVLTLPASVYASEGASFISKLKSRRDNLRGEVMKYYRFLSQEAEITGSDKDETFSITSANGGLQVTVYSTVEKKKLYQRSFVYTETYAITINGNGGNDIFEIEENVKSKIRIAIHGGEGADRYHLKGDIRTKIFDTVSDKNAIAAKETAKADLN